MKTRKFLSFPWKILIISWKVETLKILTFFLRTFHLVLHPINEETGPFNVDHFLDVDGGFVDIDPKSFLYEGYVKGRSWENLLSDFFEKNKLMLSLFILKTWLIIQNLELVVELYYFKIIFLILRRFRNGRLYWFFQTIPTRESTGPFWTVFSRATSTLETATRFPSIRLPNISHSVNGLVSTTR